VDIKSDFPQTFFSLGRIHNLSSFFERYEEQPKDLNFKIGLLASLLLCFFVVFDRLTVILVKKEVSLNKEHDQTTHVLFQQDRHTVQ
jgi:amino acid permease